MKINFYCPTRALALVFLLSGNINPLYSQTETDGLFMAKKNLCGGFMYGHSAWTHYWEGTFYRDNANLGTVSSRAVMAMATYGITDNINVIVGLPWIKTKASAGTMAGQQGIQDISASVKCRMLSADLRGFAVDINGVAGISTPLTNYVADYLPLSIGMHSTNGTFRLMADAQKKNFFTTLSASWILRSPVFIDRSAYYTTEMHYTNRVIMPEQWYTQLRAGYRKGDLIAEFIADDLSTVGGFDMRKNDMPFLSNRMNMSRIGVSTKIPVSQLKGLSFVGNSFYTMGGRNAGRSFSYMAGAVYQTALFSK